MKILLSTFTLILSFAPFAIEANQEIRTVGSLDPAVYAVATGGFWQQGQNYGNIRVVVRNVGWEHTRSQFYIQWLWSDESTKKVKEFATIPIQELNEGNWINLNKIERLSSKNGARFKLSYQVRTEENETIKILQVGEPTKYELLQE